MFRSYELGVYTALAEMGWLLNSDGPDRDKHHPPDLTSRLQALISTYLATDKFSLVRPEAFNSHTLKAKLVTWGLGSSLNIKEKCPFASPTALKSRQLEPPRAGRTPAASHLGSPSPRLPYISHPSR